MNTPMKHTTKRTILQQQRRNTALFLAPSLVGVLVFWLLPLLVVLYYSLQSRPVNGEFVGLQNYAALLRNHAFLLGAKNTALLCLTTVPLAVVLSLALALALERRLPMGGFLRSALLSPLVVPAASVVLVWQIIFHNNGLINVLLQTLGLNSADFFSSDWSRVMVLILYLWKNLGYNILLFTAGLASIPRELTDMAELDGATPWQKFRAVKIHYLGPSALFVTILSFISALKIFREVWLLAGSYPHGAMYMLQHFMYNTFLTMDYQKLCTAAVLLTAVTAVIVYAFFRWEKRVERQVQGQ